MADVQGLTRDPEFQSLPFADRRALLAEADPEFGSAPQSVQNQILAEMKTQSWWQGGGKSKTQMLPAHERGARVAPESTKDKIKRTVGGAVKAARPTLEAVGSTLGSLVGGGAALVGGQLGPQVATPEEFATVPAAAATGGALGYAGTKRLLDVVEQLAGTQPTQDLKGATLSTLKDIGTGYAGELMGLGLGAGLVGIGKAAKGTVNAARRVTGPYASRITPEKAELLRYAESKGVNISPAAATGSRTLGLVEKGLDITPTTAGIMQDFKQSGTRAYRENVVTPTLEKLGAKGKTFAESGNEAIAATARRSNVFDRLVARKFQKAKELAPVDAGDVPVISSQQAAQKILAEEADVLRTLQDNEAIGVLSEIAETPSMSLDSVQRNLSRMKEIIRSADRGIGTGTKFQSSSTAGVFKRLASALDNDLEAFSNQHGGEFYEALREARQTARAGYELFDSRAVRQMLKAEPSQLVNYFRGKNTEALNTIKRAVGPKAFNDLRATWFENLVKETPNGEIRPASLAQALNKIDEGTAKVIFNPEEWKEIKKVAKVGELLQEGERIAGNPSGTGQTLMTPAYWSSIGAMLIGGNPLSAGATLIGPPAVAKLYLSKTGRKYLTEGFKIPAGSKASEVWAKKISTFVEDKSIPMKLAEQFGKIKDKKKK